MNSSISQRLSKIPNALRIRILFSDEAIIVIHKPYLLRSVPGLLHRTSSINVTNDKSSSSLKRKILAIDENDNENVNTAKESVSNGDDKKRGVSSSRKELIQSLWIHAIQHFQNEIITSTSNLDDTDTDTDTDADIGTNNAKIILHNLSTKKSQSSLSSVPRKCKPFKRYCHRNIISLLPHLVTSSSNNTTRTTDYEIGNKKDNIQKDQVLQTLIDEAANKAHEMICKQFDILLSSQQQQGTNFKDLDSDNNNSDYPNFEHSLTSSRDEDSAYGQVKLIMKLQKEDESTNTINNHNLLSEYYYYGTIKDIPYYSTNDTVYVVHRLDCETSGVMVFARHENIASILSKCWRERDDISKTYIAKVRRWDPFDNDGQIEGCIDLPLAPMKNEKLKWQIQETCKGGKNSRTFWKLIPVVHNDSTCDGSDKNNDNSRNNDSHEHFLELKPITGRTHQLRIHCAAMGSGIINDSLYGDNPIRIDWNLIDNQKSSLYLHAYKLSFPHPSTKQNVEFTSNLVSWLPPDY